MKKTGIIVLVIVGFLSCQQDISEKYLDKDIENSIVKHKLLGVDTVYLTVWANDKVAINRDVFGINNDWREITNTQFPAAATAFKNLSSSNFLMMRFPGGWESEYYDWGTNTTPGWPLTPSQPGASLTTFKNNVSNYTIVIPTQAAMNEELWSQAWWDEVSSLKIKAKEAINLAGPDVVKVVEIGNEWWLHWGGGVTRNNKLIKYAKIAMNIAEYIGQQFSDRTFKLLVNGDYTVPSEFTTMKNQFTKAYDEIDGVVLHGYAGYDTDTHNISDLKLRIETCASNFNSNKDMYIYISEWMPSKDYNNNKVYMEAANIIPQIIHIFCRAGVDAAAYWPPINTAVPGVGLISYDCNTVYPAGQIFEGLSNDFQQHVVNTASGEQIHITGAMYNPDVLTLYVTGGDSDPKNVKINVNGFTIGSVRKVRKLRPADYTNTKLAAPWVNESSSVTVTQDNRIIFTINEAGKYEIFKIVLDRQLN